MHSNFIFLQLCIHSFIQWATASLHTFAPSRLHVILFIYFGGEPCALDTLITYLLICLFWWLVLLLVCFNEQSTHSSMILMQFVFSVFTGEAWGYLGSRRFLLELDLQSDSVNGLNGTQIEMVFVMIVPCNNISIMFMISSI